MASWVATGCCCHDDAGADVNVVVNVVVDVGTKSGIGVGKEVAVDFGVDASAGVLESDDFEIAEVGVGAGFDHGFGVGFSFDGFEVEVRKGL